MDTEREGLRAEQSCAPSSPAGSGREGPAGEGEKSSDQCGDRSAG